MVWTEYTNNKLRDAVLQVRTEDCRRARLPSKVICARRAMARAQQTFDAVGEGVAADDAVLENAKRFLGF
ncbi:MAG: hypothetical protein AAF529_06200 [Pseudomonadota bacterium]